MVSKNYNGYKVISCCKYVGVIYTMGYSVSIIYYRSHRWYVCNKIK